MQSMTPLFAAMTQGIRKLEEQEEQAEQLADKDPAEEAARKTKQKTTTKNICKGWRGRNAFA